ncbi:MAG: DEAD/DEAH box helicase [Synergistaceae bacterium]|jgi:transcription-repair coupling factor (superfamily II helicase)|nr:DEAD/DEAH box helicase [Synergistaceae bacterium]
MRTLIANIRGAADSVLDRGGTVLDRAGGAARAYVCSCEGNEGRGEGNGRGRGKGKENFLLALLPDVRSAADFASDFHTLNPNNAPLILIELPLQRESGVSSMRPLLLQRGAAVMRWIKEGGVLVCTPGSLITPCLVGGSDMSIEIGAEYRRESLISWLEMSGYHRSDLVWSPGQYVVRGFIMDVFDPVEPMPLRFEFFGDSVESIRSFDPGTQKSVASLDSVSLHSVTAARYSDFTSMLADRGGFSVVLFDPRKVEAVAESYRALWNEARIPRSREAEPAPPWDEVFSPLSRRPLLRVVREVEPAAECEFDIDEAPPFRGDISALARFCSSHLEQGYKINVFTTSQRFLDEKDGPFAELFMTGAGALTLSYGRLSSGFVSRSERVAFLSDRELSGVSDDPVVLAGLVRRPPAEWRDRLSNGQLVIHEDYGMAVFRGVEAVAPPKTIKPGPASGPCDAIILEFAENKRLMIPTSQFHKLTPLDEHESDETPLDSLSSVKWRRSAEKDRERAREEAKVILELFAKRELERRPPFAQPDGLYSDFVASFPHVETSDQNRAVAEIMEDMSRPFPMDRLLVGDVGFGKTEVAMRAAFRAILSGKQVCVLVPTTILAQQHYSTFTSRMSGFSVKVGLMSRFVSRSAMSRTAADVASGAVDILIGTHKLLGGGLKFKDLGLLVVDEEHRFGVMHKEEIKRAYGSIDILSLSATPIPRTLAMSLRGLRDISVLSTPPSDRLPVMTFAGPWQTSLARRAIANELTRGGQVYFVTNRISRMERQMSMLKELFPDADIRIAHGRMPERAMESAMLDFYGGKIDILLCTSIIESGLDVGRANTIIVDDAREFGLAQMYQLRGRVGRRGENAFAYFFYPETDESPSRDTIDRLDAIAGLTGLGSGYSLARRDLEIRGAGEFGGTRQHGRGTDGGFHFFYRMLEREIARLRGQAEQIEVTEDAGGSIPSSYIPQGDVRVTLYRRLLRTSKVCEVEELRREVADRFGPLPEEAARLMDAAAIRCGGAAAGLRSVSVSHGEVKVSGSGLAALFKGLRGWTVIGDAAKGPGGAAGVKALAEAVNARLKCT